MQYVVVCAVVIIVAAVVLYMVVSRRPPTIAASPLPPVPSGDVALEDLRQTIFVAVVSLDDVEAAGKCVASLFTQAACPARVRVGVMLHSDRQDGDQDVTTQSMLECVAQGAELNPAWLRVHQAPLAAANGPMASLAQCIDRLWKDERFVVTLDARARAEGQWDDVVLAELAVARRISDDATLTAPLDPGQGRGSFLVAAEGPAADGGVRTHAVAYAGRHAVPVPAPLWCAEFSVCARAQYTACPLPTPAEAEGLDCAARLLHGARLRQVATAMAPARLPFWQDVRTPGALRWRAVLHGHGGGSHTTLAHLLSQFRKAPYLIASEAACGVVPGGVPTPQARMGSSAHPSDAEMVARCGSVRVFNETCRAFTAHPPPHSPSAAQV